MLGFYSFNAIFVDPPKIVLHCPKCQTKFAATLDQFETRYEDQIYFNLVQHICSHCFFAMLIQRLN